DDALSGLSREDRDRIVDARRAHVLEAGGREWLLVPGAPRGRYAYSSEACGFEPADLETRMKELRGDHHLVLAWAAPDGEAGLARDGVFAFPGPAGDERDARIFVGPIAGPPHLAGEGYARPGPTLLELGPQGLRAVGTIAFRGDA